MIGPPLLLSILLAADAKPTAKLPLGKETTYVLGPLDKDGYIDYEAALNDRLGKGITPEKNANVLLWQALGPTPGGTRMPAEFFKRLGIAVPPKGGPSFIGVRTYLKDHLRLAPEEVDALAEQETVARQRPWTAKEHPHLAAWLRANEKPLAIVIAATRRPEYFNPLVGPRSPDHPGPLLGALMPGVQTCRALAVALAMRAMQRVAEGKADEAWQDLLACHRLGRLVARGATLIEALVGIAIDQIASQADLAYLDGARLTSAQVRSRLKDLQALPPMPSMADKMNLGERFLFLDSLQLVRRDGPGTLETMEGPISKPTLEEQKALDRIDWEPALRNGNRFYDRMVAALRHTDRAARERAIDRIEKETRALTSEAREVNFLKLFFSKDPPGRVVGERIGNILLGLMLPGVRKVQSAHDRSEQVERNLHVAFALAAYQREHGRYPARLDDLAPRYLAAVPDDLFAGRPLVYRLSDKGYLFYSVGVNGVDEKGRGYDDDPRGDDLAVRMPLPPLKKK
jgi:hypothetical protein